MKNTTTETAAATYQGAETATVKAITSQTGVGTSTITETVTTVQQGAETATVRTITVQTEVGTTTITERHDGWHMPPLSTAWLCDDGRMRTLGEMLCGIDADLMPRDDEDLLFLLGCFGCDWTKPVTPTMWPFGLLTA